MKKRPEIGVFSIVLQHRGFGRRRGWVGNPSWMRRTAVDNKADQTGRFPLASRVDFVPRDCEGPSKRNG